MRPIEELIEAGRVVEDSGCHSFNGKRNRYPTVGKPKQRITRFLLGLQPGDGREARHTCDNDWCINAEHLLAGTSQDNSDDMVSRGRSNTGAKHPNARLDAEQIEEIRTSTETGVVLAARLGVSRAQISRIRTGKRWKGTTT